MSTLLNFNLLDFFLVINKNKTITVFTGMYENTSFSNMFFDEFRNDFELRNPYPHKYIYS